jgi:hypothetical protein
MKTVCIVILLDLVVLHSTLHVHHKLVCIYFVSGLATIMITIWVVEYCVRPVNQKKLVCAPKLQLNSDIGPNWADPRVWGKSAFQPTGLRKVTPLGSVFVFRGFKFRTTMAKWWLLLWNQKFLSGVKNHFQMIKHALTLWVCSSVTPFWSRPVESTI